MNEVKLYGRVGKFIRKNETKKGDTVTNFTVGCSQEGYKRVDYVKVTAWKNLNIQEGMFVEVHGSIREDKYQNKDGVDVYKTYVSADDVIIDENVKVASKEEAPF